MINNPYYPTGLPTNMWNANNNFNMQQNFPQRYQVITVKGMPGANTLQMLPNSKALVLDEDEPIVYFIQTDGAGYKTVTPYDISPHQQAQAMNPFEERLAALEREVMQMKEHRGMNNESDHSADE